MTKQNNAVKSTAERVFLRQAPRELTLNEIKEVSGADRWGDLNTTYDTNNSACDAD